MAKKQKAEQLTDTEFSGEASAEKKPTDKLRKVLFWTVPSVILLALGGFTVYFFEIPVGTTALELGNKIPFVEKIIPDPDDSGPTSEEIKHAEEVNKWKQKYSASAKKLKSKEKEIAELTHELKEAAKELEQAQRNLDDFKSSNFELQQQINKEMNERVKEQMKELAAVYKSIPPKKAANMLSAMSVEDAAITLAQLNNSQQSSILSAMTDTKKAARLSLLIKEIAALQASDVTFLKAQVRQIALQQENPTETLAETLSGMQPAQAAGIIKSMMATNSYSVIELLKQMDAAVRAKILTEIQASDANMATEIASGLNR